MAYRTYINGTQVFGNNEYYPEWIKYLKSKGITIGEEDEYDGEIDDFMEALNVVESIVIRLEAERRERKKNGEEFYSSSIFDLGNIYDAVVANPARKSIFGEELYYLENGYMFMPYAFFKACESILEYKGLSLKGKVFKLKDGCKIKVSAG